MYQRWFAACVGLALTAVSIGGVTPADTTAVQRPRYTADGKLLRPAGYREWVFLSSGLGMNYNPQPDGKAAPPEFTNVYAEPGAYRAFMQTGRWPDGAVLILEIYSAATQG